MLGTRHGGEAESRQGSDAMTAANNGNRCRRRIWTGGMERKQTGKQSKDTVEVRGDAGDAGSQDRSARWFSPRAP